MLFHWAVESLSLVLRREVELIRDMLWQTRNANLNEPNKKPHPDAGESVHTSPISTTQPHGPGRESALGLLQNPKATAAPFHPGMQHPASCGGPQGVESNTPWRRVKILAGSPGLQRKISFQIPAKSSPSPSFAAQTHADKPERAAIASGQTLDLWNRCCLG